MTRLPSRNNHITTTLQRVAMMLVAVVCVSACSNLPTPRTSSVTPYTGEIPSQSIADLHCATTPADRPSQIISHTGYTLSYNSEWKLANWVGYELTSQETRGTVKRSDRFDEDPCVEGYQVRHADYTHSGFDRGHMAPAADMKWSEEAMDESFYMSNICPQVHALNAGRWNDLENKVRKWAQRDSAIIVVCGPIVPHDYSTISEQHIAVPRHFFKIVASPYSNPPRGIGFIMPNEDIDEPLYTYAVTIDQVEAATGIDFLYALPDSLENHIEQHIDLQSWHL